MRAGGNLLTLPSAGPKAAAFLYAFGPGDGRQRRYAAANQSRVRKASWPQSYEEPGRAFAE